MTLFRNSFEGGTNGAGLTSGNSGGISGTAMRTNIVGASTVTYSTDHPMTPPAGTLGIKHDSAASGVGALRTPTGISSADASCSFDFYFPTLPVGGSHPLITANNAANEALFTLYVQTDGTVRGRQRGAATNTTGLSSLTNTISAATAYRLDVEIVPGTTTGNGTIKWRICPQNSNTPVTGMDCALTTADAGTTPVVYFDGGQAITTSAAHLVYTDNWAWNDAAGGSFIGAFTAPSNALPVAVAPAKQRVLTGQTATLAGTSSDSDGTVVSHSWTPSSWPAGAATPSLSNATTATATMAAQSVPGIYTFDYKVQDNTGAFSLPVTARVGVAMSDGSCTPRTDKSNPGAWTGSYLQIDEITLDTGDYRETPDAPANAAVTMWMNPINDGALSFTKLVAALAPVAGASCTIKIGIISGTGSTVIAERTFNLTDVPTNYPVTDLTSGEQSAFTDRIDWAVVITGNQT